MCKMDFSFNGVSPQLFFFFLHEYSLCWNINTSLDICVVSKLSYDNSTPQSKFDFIPVNYNQQ